MIVSSYIIQANVITIINYDHKTFKVHATGVNIIILYLFERVESLSHKFFKALLTFVGKTRTFLYSKEACLKFD
jgi:hypothetical protein